MKTLIIIYYMTTGAGIDVQEFRLERLSPIECTQLKQDYVSELKSNSNVDVLSARCVEQK